MNGGTLLLSYEDISPLFNVYEIVKAVEEAFREKGLGRVQMPPKQYIFFKEGDWRIMPAYIPSMNVAGVKTVGVNPKNRERGLATVIALITLVDPDTGAPLVVMDGTLITAWRTGAAGAVAAKYLARRDSRVMGIVGAGVQGRYQAIFTLSVMKNINEVKIYDVRKEASKKLGEMLEKEFGVDVKIAESPMEASKGVDVLATCTPAREPIIKDEWIEEGTHINAIGADAPGKEELEPTLLKRAKIVVDDKEQAAHSGEINVPLRKGYITLNDIYAELGEIVAGLKPGREDDSEITIFDSTGLAIQDVATAKVIYERALKEGRGKRIKLVFM